MILRRRVSFLLVALTFAISSASVEAAWGWEQKLTKKDIISAISAGATWAGVAGGVTVAAAYARLPNEWPEWTATVVCGSAAQAFGQTWGASGSASIASAAIAASMKAATTVGVAGVCSISTGAVHELVNRYHAKANKAPSRTRKLLYSDLKGAAKHYNQAKNYAYVYIHYDGLYRSWMAAWSSCIQTYGHALRHVCADEFDTAQWYLREKWAVDTKKDKEVKAGNWYSWRIQQKLDALPN